MPAVVDGTAVVDVDGIVVPDVDGIAVVDVDGIVVADVDGIAVVDTDGVVIVDVDGVFVDINRFAVADFGGAVVGEGLTGIADKTVVDALVILEFFSAAVIAGLPTTAVLIATSRVC